MVQTLTKDLEILMSVYRGSEQLFYTETHFAFNKSSPNIYSSEKVSKSLGEHTNIVTYNAMLS